MVQTYWQIGYLMTGRSPIKESEVYGAREQMPKAQKITPGVSLLSHGNEEWLLPLDEENTV